jgi:hypothetical protein
LELIDGRFIETTDFAGLKNIVSEEVAAAKQHAAPVIIFPYGPKPLLFGAAYQLSMEYTEASWFVWFVYPIPGLYDSSYTTGSERTVWFGIASEQAR